MELKHTNIFRNARRPATFWSTVLAMILCVGTLLAATAAEAASPRRVDFDHLRTGFPLTGAHTVVQCETCHTRGIFRGTPTQCSSCHSPGSGIASTSKSSNHIPTTAQCSQCHSSTTVWTGARFSHASAKSGTCTTCHDGSKAKGKPTGHMPTSASCDTCHRTTAWTPATGGALPNDAFHTFAGTSSCTTCHSNGMMSASGVRFSHSGIASGCANCHKPTTLNSITARGKPNDTVHNGTTSPCETCHTSTSSFKVVSSSAKPADAFHTFAGTSTCTTCHTGGGMMGSTGVKFSHSGIASGCFNCHKPTTINSVTAKGKPGDAFHNFAGTSTCETCHTNTSSFVTARFSHTSVLPASCASCHVPTTINNVTAKGKPNDDTHNGNTSPCDTCHTNFTSFLGATGGAKPADAFHTFAGTTTCTTCHTSGGMMGSTGVKFSHLGISSGCFNCHKPTTLNGVTAKGKPGDAFHNFAGTSSCETCHTNTSSFLTVRFSHASVVPRTCANCHVPTTINNVTAKGKNFTSNHPVTTDSCDVCHTNFSTFTGAVGGAKPNDVFHTFAGAGTTCTTCHTNGMMGSTGVRFSHSGITSGCFNCHKPTTLNGVTAKGKPGDAFHNFAGTSSCETCHTNTSSFLTVRFSHASVLPRTCANCHVPTTINNVTAKGKNFISNHPITTDSCDVCHTNFSTFTGAVGGAKPNDTFHLFAGAGTSCTTCHSGPPSTANARFNHTGIAAGCFNCHKPTTINGVTAKGKPGDAFHIFAGVTTCESCHSTSGFTSFLTSVRFRHDGIASGCINCHKPLTFNGFTARGKPGNHIPYETQLLAGSSLTCESCHRTTSSFSVSKTDMNHNNSQGNGAGWCTGCHLKGSTWLGGMEKKDLTHEKKTGVTDCSQSGCHRPLGNRGTPYTKW